MAIQSITKRIHANTEYDGANVVCTETGEGVVLVDTPMVPKDIAHWKEFVLGLDPRGVRCITLTHNHFDHIIGCNQLGGAVIMQEKGRESLFGEDATLRDSMAGLSPDRTPEEVEFILSEPLIPAQITFAAHLMLHLGETTLELRHVGGHSPDSILVYAVEDRILMTGDNLTAATHPYKGHACFGDWIKALQFMSTLDVDTVVPGHGEVCGKEEIGRFLEYMSGLWTRTRELTLEGLSRQEIVTRLHDEMFGYFEVEPARLEAAGSTFDLGTERLHREILERQGAGAA